MSLEIVILRDPNGNFLRNLTMITSVHSVPGPPAEDSLTAVSKDVQKSDMKT